LLRLRLRLLLLLGRRVRALRGRRGVLAGLIGARRLSPRGGGLGACAVGRGLIGEILLGLRRRILRDAWATLVLERR
jgi:hypothetical protein